MSLSPFTVPIYSIYRSGIQDSAWRYSEAFLVLLEGDLERAYNLYVRALEGYVSEFTVNSVIKFIESYYEKNPNKNELLFILGLIHEKNERNYPMAMEWYEKFVEVSADNPDYESYLEKSHRSLEQLKQTMGLQ